MHVVTNLTGILGSFNRVMNTRISSSSTLSVKRRSPKKNKMNLKSSAKLSGFMRKTIKTQRRSWLRTQKI